MHTGIIERRYMGWTGAVLISLVLGLAAGCKNQQPPARSDQQIAGDVQAKLHGEAALAQQNIDVSVANGVATLSGSVSDEASRALAGNDSGTVAGVKTVVNNLTVQAAQQVPTPNTQPGPQASVATPRPPARPRTEKQPRHGRVHDQQPAPAPAPAPAPIQDAAEVAPPPHVQAPPPPPAPPKPVVKDVTLAAGTVVPIRVTETLNSKTAQPNDVFHGSIAGDLGTQGVIAIPRGTAVMGRIVDAREAAHFQGNSLLSLELTQATVRGQRVDLLTDTYSKAGAGRGKNTVEKAGGGAALGAIIGAIAGGGKGAAIGGLAGGGAGAGINAATRGEQTVIPTETVINFRLQSPITLRVTIPPPGGTVSSDPIDPPLQPR